MHSPWWAHSSYLLNSYSLQLLLSKEILIHEHRTFIIKNYYYFRTLFKPFLTCELDFGGVEGKR
jgi:hypothetical protein